MKLNSPFHLSLLQVQIGVVLPSKLPDLYQEVSQMVLKLNWNNICENLILTNLETRYILVEVEKTSHCDLDLVVGQVGESRLQQIRNKTLEKMKFGVKQQDDL